MSEPRQTRRMMTFLKKFVFVHTAEEHRMTRWLLMLTTLATGWSIAGMMHGFGVLGF